MTRTEKSGMFDVFLWKNGWWEKKIVRSKHVSKVEVLGIWSEFVCSLDFVFYLF